MRRVYLRQVRVERSETTGPFAATARRASEASHPARPTNVKMALAALFLLSAVPKDSHFYPMAANAFSSLQNCKP